MNLLLELEVVVVFVAVLSVVFFIFKLFVINIIIIISSMIRSISITSVRLTYLVTINSFLFYSDKYIHCSSYVNSV